MRTRNTLEIAVIDIPTATATVFGDCNEKHVDLRGFFPRVFRLYGMFSKFRERSARVERGISSHRERRSKNPINNYVSVEILRIK